MSQTRREQKQEQRESRRQMMRHLYVEDGLSLRAVGRLMGCTHQNVAQVLGSMRVKLRKRGGNMGGHSRHRG